MIKFTFLKFNLATVGQEGNLGDQLGPRIMAMEVISTSQTQVIMLNHMMV